MIPFKQLASLSLVLLLCIICKASSHKKPDSSSPFTILPSEITSKITSYLPNEEQNKMFLVSKALFNQTYFLKKKNRIRAFKNYLMYPYLSRFAVHLLKNFDVLFNTDEESNTLKDLLRYGENKKIFYQLLLREAHPDYFDIDEWCSFFGLKSSELREIPLQRDNETEYAYVRTIYFDPEREDEIYPLLTTNDVQKIVIIKLSRVLAQSFNMVDLAENIVNVITKDGTAGKDDRIRIIFKEEKNAVEKTELYFQNIVALETSLFHKLYQADITVKIIDRTALQLPYDSDYPTNAKQFPGVITYVAFQQKILDEGFRNSHPNLVVKPYYNTNLDDILEAYNPDSHNQIIDDASLIYLCNKNFGLMLADGYWGEAGWLDVCNQIKNYVSPFALMRRKGRTFLEKVFDQAREHDVITEFFIPFVKSYGIDLNTYIYHGNQTFLMNLIDELEKSNFRLDAFLRNGLGNPTENQRLNKLFHAINVFIAQGINPMFEPNNNMTLLEYFFSKMHVFPNNTSIGSDYFVIFENFLKYQTVAINSNAMYGMVTSKKNTMLHSYFKYANVLNLDIINTIMDADALDVNVRNNDGETAFESFISFVSHFNTKTQRSSLRFVPFDDIVEKFIKRGFDFTLPTKDKKPLSSLESRAPDLRWDRIEPLINRQFKKSRW